MSLYKSARSPYWRIQFQLGGQTYVKSSKTSSKTVAKRMEDEWRTAIHNRTIVGGKEPITIDEMFKNYLAMPHSKNTLRNARSLYNRLAKFTNLNIKATEFNQIAFERYVEHCRKLGNKDSSINASLRVIGGAWGSVNRKLYQIPELNLPKVKAGEGRTEFFTEDDEKQLLSFLSARTPRTYGASRPNELYDVFVLLLDTGARANEIATLTWEQVDLANRKLDIWRSKTSSRSYLTMTNRIHSILQQRADKKLHPSFVFPNKARDNHRTLETQYLNRILKKAGIVKTVHHIRHGMAMRLLKAGMSLNDVRAILGHKRISTTQRYQHIEADDVSPRAADILNKATIESNRSQIRIA